jgi:acetyl esterase
VSGADIEARLDPEMRAALAENATAVAGWEAELQDLPAARLAYARGRNHWNADRPEVARVRNALVPGPHGPIPVRIYRPLPGNAPLPVLVFVHGGGYVLGSNDTHDRVMRLLALKSGAAVLGVDYRLAPEHRFPAQLEETAAVLDWLEAQAASVELDRGRVALGGDSAGAHISLGVALQRKGRAPALKALILYYGAFGLADSESRRRFGVAESGLSRKDLAFYEASYLGGPVPLGDPRYDCLAGDLSGLPPAYILACELDPLLDDSLALAKGLAAAGVPCRLARYDGVLHGFIHYSRAIPKAMRALDEGAAALKDWL